MTGSSLCRTRTLANLLHREHAALCSLYPADTRSSPQPRAGGHRVQLPGGAAFDSRSRRSRNYELLDPTRREGVRCAARLHTRTHHLCLHAHTPIPLSSLTAICVCWLGVQAAFDKCHYRVRHFDAVVILKPLLELDPNTAGRVEPAGSDFSSVLAFQHLKSRKLALGAGSLAATWRSGTSADAPVSRAATSLSYFISLEISGTAESQTLLYFQRNF